jgi:hypothetical protein
MSRKQRLEAVIVKVLKDQELYSNEEIAGILLAEFREACWVNKIKLPASYLGDLKY